MNAKKYPFLEQLQLPDNVVLRLSHLLDGTITGRSEVFSTPLHQLGPESILEDWDSVLNDKLPGVPELIEIEESNRAKFGPRSIQVPWEDRKDSVDTYFEVETPGNYNLEVPIPSQAKRLRPLSVESAGKWLRTDTNSGLPYFERKANVLQDALIEYDTLMSERYPCICFTRTQELGKTRNVWGYPIADTINEMRYFRPLHDFQRNLPWRSALLGPEFVDQSINRILNDNPGDTFLSVDFSAYDASVKKSLQNLAFDYIEMLFQDVNDPYGLDYIRERFNTIGLITPDGIRESPHGVPSGSTFTNEVDSIAQFTVAMNSGLVRDDSCQVQGDDGVYVTRDTSQLLDFFKSANLNVNEEKSHISDNYVVYLQNLHSKSLPSKDGLIRGIYPTYRALSRLVFLERFDSFKDFDLDGKDYFSIRAITILENCKHHPLFEDLVKFVVDRDKYGLVPSDKGIANYVKMRSAKDGSVGLFNHQYGDNIQGIKNFETYKIIMTML
jgi:hypothetical protein